MTRDEYIAAVNTVIKHDKMVSRIRDVSRDLAREVGDDFGGVAITPESGLREAFIRIVEIACGDTSRQTTYLFEEGMTMKGGGSLTLRDGTVYPITNAGNCWDAIRAFEA